MKNATKLIAALGAALGLGAGSAQAITCHSWSCVNSHLNSMQSALKTDAAIISQDNRAIGNLANCLGESPLTRYGDPAGSLGYVFDPGSGGAQFDTTALDVTNSGNTIGGWAMFDKCNTQTTASFRRGHASAFSTAFGPIAPEMQFGPPVEHH